MTNPPAGPPERAPRELTVPVTALGGARGGPRRAALLAAIAVVVVIGLGVASSDIFPVSPSPVASGAPNGSAPVTPTIAAADTPGPRGPGDLTPRVDTGVVSVAGLVTGVAKGSGTGRIVLVARRMTASSRPCGIAAPQPACRLLTIEGIQGVRVVPDPAITVWPGDPAFGSVLVLEQRVGELVYLGSLVDSGAGIPNVTALLTRLAGSTPEPVATLPTLYEADGWLITNAVHACLAPETSCPPPPPFLAAAEPLADGSLVTGAGVPVRLTSPVPGVNAADTWTSGPFLLRRRAAGDCPAAVAAPCFPDPDTWEVVAREDTSNMVRVLVPGP